MKCRALKGKATACIAAQHWEQMSMEGKASLASCMEVVIGIRMTLPALLWSKK